MIGVGRAEAARRARHAEVLLVAAHVLRCHARPELADEVCHLANRVGDGTLPFVPPIRPA